jgi:ribosomal protein S18 acetylase RimI-like enzyme
MSSKDYYKKYIKYKQKYIQLKQKINMTGGAEDFGENKICLYKDIDKLDLECIKNIEDLVSIHRTNPKYPDYVFKMSQFLSELKFSNSNEYNKIINNSKISYIIDENNTKNKVIAICRGVYKPYKNSVYISMVHVSESYRGKGLCMQVVDNLIKSYKGINYFNLDVLANNIPAVKCYLRLGFKLTNHVDGEKVHYMVKK